MVRVMGIEMGRPSVNYSFSEPLFRGVEHRNEVFSEVFAFNHSTRQVRGSSENENVLPAPILLFTATDPPINSASREQIASPSPLPPYVRVIDPSACVNA